MLRALYLAFGFSMLPLCAALAQSPSDQKKPLVQTSLPALLHELEETNPEIQAARHRFEAATKVPSQAGSLPDPRISVSNFGVGRPVSALNESDFAYHGLGVTQDLPFPGKLSLASEEAQKESESEHKIYDATLQELTSRLKVAYFEWASTAKQIEITSRSRNLLERFAEIAGARYSAGKAIQQEVLKAHLELTSLAQQLELLQQKRAKTEAEIQYLLGREDTLPLGAPTIVTASPFSSDLQALLAAADKNAPRIRAKQLLVESRAVGVQRKQKEYLPDFSVGVQWQHTGSDFPDYYLATAEVKLPLYFWTKQRFGVEEAESRLQESRESYRSTRQETAYLVKEQFLAAKSSERLLSLYESGSIPQATLTLDSTISAYEVGRVDFLTLLNSLTSLLSFEKQYYQELARHEQALARLEPLVGEELVRP